MADFFDDDFEFTLDNLKSLLASNSSNSASSIRSARKEEEDPEVELARDIETLNVEICAPTNRAVAVLKRKGVPCRTLHSAMYELAYQQPLTDAIVQWLAIPQVRATELDVEVGVAQKIGQLIDPQPLPKSPWEVINELTPAKRGQLRSDYRKFLARCLKHRVPENVAWSMALSGALRNADIDVYQLQDRTVGSAGWVVRSGEGGPKIRIGEEFSLWSLRMVKDFRNQPGVRGVLMCGDPRQLPMVISQKDLNNPDIPADAKVPFTDMMRHPQITNVRLEEVVRQDESNPAAAKILKFAETIGHFIDCGNRDEQGRSLTLTSVITGLERIAAGKLGIEFSPAYPCTVMLDAPAIVGFNSTRLRVIAEFRRAMGYAPDAVSVGEPLVLDWIRGGEQAEDKFKQVGLVRNSNWKLVDIQIDGTWVLEGPDGEIVRNVGGRMSETPSVVAAMHKDFPELADDPYAQFKFKPSVRDAALYFQSGAATTCHRSQGGEWDTVVVSMADLKRMASFNRSRSSGAPEWLSWLYTAVTRSRHRLIFAVGPKPAVTLDPQEGSTLP